MDVALVDDLLALGLGIGLGVQLFRFLICWLPTGLIPVVIVLPWCLRRRPSLLVLESV